MKKKGMKSFPAWMFFPVFLVVLAIYGQAAAQEVKGPEVINLGAPGSFDGDIRDLPKAPPWKKGDPVMIRREGLLPDWMDVPGKKKASPPPASPADPVLDKGSAAEAADAFTPGLNFAGIGFGGVYPPDTVGDVGLNHYIQMVNDVGGSRFQIWDKNGVSLAGPTVLDTLWTAGGACASGLGDPIVLYDRLANRWLMSEFASSGNHLCVYVSKTSDPVAGGWWLYDFATPVFPDYPKYGVWNDAYYVSTYEGANLGIFALQRSAMLSGGAAGVLRFTIPSLTPSAGVRETRILPATSELPAPPSGAPNPFFRSVEAAQDVNNPTDRIEIWEFLADFATPANSTFTLVNTLTPAAFTLVPCSPGIRDCIPQQGTTVKLDALTNRPMHKLQYRNFGETQSMVTNQAVDAGGGVSGIRWYEVSRGTQTTGGWYIRQQGTYSPDANGRWMGSIAQDDLGNMALGYSVSSSSVYPSIRYTGRLYSDTLGVMTQGETTVIAGSAPQTATQRWGDYSAMNVDPVKPCTFWYTQEYIPIGGQWQTRINSFGLPGCGFNYCFKDPSYVTLYLLTTQNNGWVLRGTAFVPGGASGFPAPLTGLYDYRVDEANMSIAYKGSGALRNYLFTTSTMSGSSWAIFGDPPSYYDGPRAASLGACPAGSLEPATEQPFFEGGETGAAP